MSEKTICEKCGTEMLPIDPCKPVGMKCPKCGWGWATTYIEAIEQDQTLYTMSIDKQDPLIDAVKLVAEVFSCNFLEARKSLIDGTFNVSGRACDIQKKAALLKKGNVSFRIEPEFPYSIEEQEG